MSHIFYPKVWKIAADKAFRKINVDKKKNEYTEGYCKWKASCTNIIISLHIWMEGCVFLHFILFRLQCLVENIPSHVRRDRVTCYYFPLCVLSQCHPPIIVPLCASSRCILVGCSQDSDCQLISTAPKTQFFGFFFIIPQWGSSFFFLWQCSHNLWRRRPLIWPFGAYWRDISSCTLINHAWSSEFQTTASQICHRLGRHTSAHSSIERRLQKK